MYTEWIQSVSGLKLYYDGRNTSVSVEEIAHALSNICRFAGHTNNFYSVAEHSMLVAKYLPPELKVWGLLHDAAEIWIGDIPTPFKRMVPEIKAIENTIIASVAYRFGLTYPMPQEVKDMDTRILYSERPYVHKEHLDWGWKVDPIDIRIEFMPPFVARDCFIQMWDNLSIGVQYG